MILSGLNNIINSILEYLNILFSSLIIYSILTFGNFKNSPFIGLLWLARVSLREFSLLSKYISKRYIHEWIKSNGFGYYRDCCRIDAIIVTFILEN